MNKLSLIIPAAGRGSRLGYHKPKLLFPINGSSILQHLLNKFDESVREVIVVCSEDGLRLIQEEVERIENHYPHLKINYKIQKTPDGMLNAIEIGAQDVQTDDLAIIWGDQVLLQKKTIDLAISTHFKFKDAGLTFPTIMKDDPYIQIIRNNDNRIIRILQKREGEIHDNFGESDVGFFVFNRDCLMQIIKKIKNNKNTQLGIKTGELNILPAFPMVYEMKKKIYTITATEDFESIGINNLDDALFAESVLSGL